MKSNIISMHISYNFSEKHYKILSSKSDGAELRMDLEEELYRFDISHPAFNYTSDNVTSIELVVFGSNTIFDNIFKKISEIEYTIEKFLDSKL
jgi:predicted DNA binding protein